MTLDPSDEDWGNGSESYFYLPNSKFETSICFGFDKNYSAFSVGIDIGKKDENYRLDKNYLFLKKEVSLKLSLIIGNDENYPNWAYLHYYGDAMQNWSMNDNIWEGIDNGQTCLQLMAIIDNIIKGLSDVKL